MGWLAQILHSHGMYSFRELYQLNTYAAWRYTRYRTSLQRTLFLCQGTSKMRAGAMMGVSLLSSSFKSFIRKYVAVLGRRQPCSVMSAKGRILRAPPKRLHRNWPLHCTEQCCKKISPASLDLPSSPNGDECSRCLNLRPISKQKMCRHQYFSQHLKPRPP